MLVISINKCFALTFLTYEDKVTNLKCFNMILAQALRNVRNIEPRIDRQRVLAETLKNPEKLAKMLLRIEFLTACRKWNILPRFIEDSLKPIKKNFSNNRHVEARSKVFASSLLSEAISDSFRRKAFLERRRVTLGNEVATFLGNQRLYELKQNCNMIFDSTIRENRPGLISKFNRLRQSKREEKQASDNQTEDSTTHNISGNTKKVNNLSSLVLQDFQTGILSKGPNFAVTQSVSKKILLEVEKSVERLGYAKRWIDDIERRKQYRLTSGLANLGETPIPGQQQHKPEDTTAQDGGQQDGSNQPQEADVRQQLANDLPAAATD